MRDLPTPPRLFHQIARHLGFAVVRRANLPEVDARASAAASGDSRSSVPRESSTSGILTILLPGSTKQSLTAYSPIPAAGLSSKICPSRT